MGRGDSFIIIYKEFIMMKNICALMVCMTVCGAA
jgi:hypothetical protein